VRANVAPARASASARERGSEIGRVAIRGHFTIIVYLSAARLIIEETRANPADVERAGGKRRSCADGYPRRAFGAFVVIASREFINAGNSRVRGAGESIAPDTGFPPREITCHRIEKLFRRDGDPAPKSS